MAIRHGVYGILVKDTKVLMVKTQSGPLAIWNFPGGGIDAGEKRNSIKRIAACFGAGEGACAGGVGPGSEFGRGVAEVGDDLGMET